MRNVGEACRELLQILERAVEKNLASAILLSGGLDASILASIGSRFTSLKAFTVAFDEGEASDLTYARLVAKHLGLDHSIHIFTRAEIFQAIPRVVDLVRSFDPMEIRNDVAIFIALNQVRSSGFTAVMTGDGCDELFAGYSFLSSYSGDRLRLELEKLQNAMSFSSVALGRAIGVEVRLPFLEPEVRSFARKVDSSYLLYGPDGERQGKWILRKAFEETLPKEVAWRAKTPIERGTGTAALPEILDREIPDTEFNYKRKKYLQEDRVALRDKEQLFYYESYRKVIGVPHHEDPNSKTCPMCNSNINEGGSYCGTCGAHPI